MIKIVYVTDKYTNYLRQFDNKVCFNKGESRPYIGILFKVKNHKYYAPLSSPKQKHLTMKNSEDMMKIDAGKLGVINFNNMIPVVKDSIINFNILDEKNLKYRQLLIKQAIFFKDNEIKILNRATNLYNSYNKGTLRQEVRQRCCNYTLLEQKSKLFNKKGN